MNSMDDFDRCLEGNLKNPEFKKEYNKLKYKFFFRVLIIRLKNFLNRLTKRELIK